MEGFDLNNAENQNNESVNGNDSGIKEQELEQEMTEATDQATHSSSNAKQNLIAILLILAAVLGFFFYVQPTRADLESMEANVSDLTNKENALKNDLVNLQNAGESLDLNSEVKTQELISAIPDKLEQDQLILDLVEIAKKNDISFQSISFGLSGDSDEEVKQVSVSASFEGNYGDLIHFLKAIEQSSRKMVVDNISVQLLGEAVNGIERVHFSLSILAFYRNGI